MPIRRPIKSTVNMIHLLPYDKNYSANILTEVTEDVRKVLNDIGNFERRINKCINKKNRDVMEKIFLFEPNDIEKLKEFLETTSHPVRLVIHGEGNPAVIGPTNKAIPAYDLLAYQLAGRLAAIIPTERADVTIDLLTCCSAVTEKIITAGNLQETVVELNFAKDLSSYLSVCGLNNITTVGYTGYVNEADSPNKYRVSSGLSNEPKARREITQTSQEKAALHYINGVLENEGRSRQILISGREVSGRDIDSFRLEAAEHKKNIIAHIEKKEVLTARNAIVDLAATTEGNIPPTEITASNSELSATVTPNAKPMISTQSIIQSTTVSLRARASSSPMNGLD